MALINTTDDLPFSEKHRILQNDLERNGIQLETVFTKQTLLELLDRRLTNRTFDRGIADQLYERYPKDNYGRFTAGDFLKVYLEAEGILRDKIKQIDVSINEYEKQRSEVMEKLEVIKKEERLNPYGVMDGSKLIVQLLRFDYANPAVPRNIYVTLACEQNVLRSQVVEYNGGAVWNEEFDIDIVTGLGDVHISVLGFNYSEDPVLLGELRVPLAKLKDQQIHEEVCDLFDRNGHLVGGKINLSLHWIFSKVKYLNDVARKWDDHIRMHWDDRTDCERDLKVLYEIFPSLLDAYPKPEAKKALPQNATAYMTHLHKTLSPVKDRLEVHDEAMVSQEITLDWKEVEFWGHLSVYGSIALLALALFACFFKADYIDILASLAFLVHFNAKGIFRGSANKMYYLFLAMFAAIAIDLLWLVVYARTWNIVVRGLELTANLSNFTIVIMWFEIPVKFLLALSHYKFTKFVRVTEGRLANIELHQVRFSTTAVKNY